MKKIWKKFLVFMTMGSIIFNSGCVYLVVGGIGAVGGYIVSPDTVEGVTDHDAGVVWNSASEVMAIMGLIDEESEDSGIILGSVSGAKLTITVTSLSSTTTKLTVKARKNFLPRISLAQDVFVKVMSRVEE